MPRVRDAPASAATTKTKRHVPKDMPLCAVARGPGQGFGLRNTPLVPALKVPVGARGGGVPEGGVGSTCW